jgi:hypothetical protein
LTEKTQISADTTIGLQRVEIKKNAPCVTAWANKKRLRPERHFTPCHRNDLRRALAICRRENADMIAGGFDALKRETHRPHKCTVLGEIADIYFAAVVGSDRVQQFRSAHDGGRVLCAALRFDFNQKTTQPE